MHFCRAVQYIPFWADPITWLKPSRRIWLLAQAPNQEALCYKDRYEEWEQQYACKVVTSTRDTFQDMFDDDNTLAYEPESTAAVILTGGDEEAEAAALEVNPSLVHVLRIWCDAARTLHHTS